MMTIIILDSIAMAAILALLVTIIVDHKHDSEINNYTEEVEMKDVHYYICESIENKRKVYIAISKEDITKEIPARKFANNKYFKTKDENLESTIGYIFEGNLYFGLMADNIKGEKVWMISRRDKKKESK